MSALKGAIGVQCHWQVLSGRGGVRPRVRDGGVHGDIGSSDSQDRALCDLRWAFGKTPSCHALVVANATNSGPVWNEYRFLEYGAPHIGYGTLAGGPARTLDALGECFE